MYRRSQGAQNLVSFDQKLKLLNISEVVKQREEESDLDGR